MTREEQIRKTARSSLEITTDEEFHGFLKGAEWADGNRWVKVEDGLPEITNVLVTYKNGVMECKYIDGDFLIFPYSEGLAYPTSIPGVTHWMPLPSPPKAEQ